MQKPSLLSKALEYNVKQNHQGNDGELRQNQRLRGEEEGKTVGVVEQGGDGFGVMMSCLVVSLFSSRLDPERSAANEEAAAIESLCYSYGKHFQRNEIKSIEELLDFRLGEYKILVVIGSSGGGDNEKTLGNLDNEKIAKLGKKIQHMEIVIFNIGLSFDFAESLYSSAYTSERLRIMCWATVTVSSGMFSFGRKFLEEVLKNQDDCDGAFKRTHNSLSFDTKQRKNKSFVMYQLGTPARGKTQKEPLKIGKPCLFPHYLASIDNLENYLRNLCKAVRKLAKRLEEIDHGMILREQENRAPDQEWTVEEIKTFYCFGAFFGWLDIVRREIPELIYHDSLCDAEWSFSGEFPRVDLRDRKLINKYTTSGQAWGLGIIAGGVMNLYKMEMRSIGEVMTSKDDNWVMLEATFLVLWTGGGDPDQREMLKRQFVKLQRDMIQLRDKRNYCPLAGNPTQLKLCGRYHARVTWIANALILLNDNLKFTTEETLHCLTVLPEERAPNPDHAFHDNAFESKTVRDQVERSKRTRTLSDRISAYYDPDLMIRSITSLATCALLAIGWYNFNHVRHVRR